MRILIAAVGRAKPGPHLDLQRLYGDRLGWGLTVSEVEERRKLSPAERCQRESEMLLAKVPERAVVIALDERGTVLSSAAFAQKITKWRDAGASDLAFLIGGADGHSDSLRQRADFLLSLGPMTWPHLLVRGMLLEQLYRAQQILAGHPYHRE
ncbi:MAG: 23S rRNA (pseudouridine(1915)-N(3))-methyltransferase RlmH [Alphaproteobacteria bacterium]|nr:23S rRNA (pseudouridine(1915)-N(3))-methyltransferase RlmH [Alphaproteobacteria bacterium]